MKIDTLYKIYESFPWLDGDEFDDMPDGWSDLITSFLIYYEYASGGEPPVITSVYIEFGGLRIHYAATNNDMIDSLVTLTEQVSFSVCHECGDVATMDSATIDSTNLNVKPQCDICRSEPGYMQELT